MDSEQMELFENQEQLDLALFTTMTNVRAGAISDETIEELVDHEQDY